MQVLWSTAEARKWRRFRQTCTYQPSPNAFFRPFLHQAHTRSDPFYVTVMNIYREDIVFATFVVHTQHRSALLGWRWDRDRSIKRMDRVTRLTGILNKQGLDSVQVLQPVIRSSRSIARSLALCGAEALKLGPATLARPTSNRRVSSLHTGLRTGLQRSKMIARCCLLACLPVFLRTACVQLS